MLYLVNKMLLPKLDWDCKGVKMKDAIASHIIAVTKEVFGINYKDNFNQLGQMSKFIKELDKEFDIKYKD